MWALIRLVWVLFGLLRAFDLVWALFSLHGRCSIKCSRFFRSRMGGLRSSVSVYRSFMGVVQCVWALFDLVSSFFGLVWAFGLVGAFFGSV